MLFKFYDQSSVVFIVGPKTYNAIQYNDNWEMNIPQKSDDTYILTWFF